MPKDDSRLVYSTEGPVPRKETPSEKKHYTTVSSAPGGPDRKITVRVERKGRGGKAVSVIEGIRMPQKEREALLKQIKVRLGTGGTLKGDAVEIQGDLRDAIVEFLEKAGFRPKRT